MAKHNENLEKSEDNHDFSVLEKMILRNGPESVIPSVMAFDMMNAGVDTTGDKF